MFYLTQPIAGLSSLNRQLFSGRVTSLFGFGSGWTLTVWLFVIIFIRIFSIWLLLSGLEVFQFPHHRQYLFVSGYFMKISIVITFLFFGILPTLVGQNRYEQFKQYFSDSLKQRDKSFSCIKTYEQKAGDKKHLFNIIYFNNDGLPTTVKQMDDTIELNRNDFSYKNGKLFSIEEFHKKDKFLIAELDYVDNGIIRSVSESVFSSLTKEKLPTHNYNYQYYGNGQLKQIYVFEGNKTDTVEIQNFNNSGKQITSYMNYGGLTTKRIEFIWNKDSTECKEIHYDDNNKAYNTIVSKFKNKLIIQKIDKSTSPTPFYWKYDKLNRVVETNSGMFYTQKYFYNEKGLLAKQTMTVVEKFNYNNFPKTIEATYDYVQR